MGEGAKGVGGVGSWETGIQGRVECGSAYLEKGPIVPPDGLPTTEEGASNAFSWAEQGTSS